MRYFSGEAIRVRSESAQCPRAAAAAERCVWGWGVSRGRGVASCDATASLSKPGELLLSGLTEL